MALLDQCIIRRESESDLYFLRGLLNYLTEKSVEAIGDLETAVEKAEDNMPWHYIAKGLCYAHLKLY